MKKVLFLIMSAFVALSGKAQYDIKYRANDNYYLIKYGLDTTHVIPKGTTYAKLQYGNEVGLFYNNGQPIVNYVSHFLYNINGASVATPNALMDSLANILGMPLDSGSGGGSVTASNGLKIMGDGSVGLGGVVDKEETYINVTTDYPLYIYNEDYDVGFIHNGNYIEMRGSNATLAMGDDVSLQAPLSTLASSDYVVMVDNIGGGANHMLRLVPKSEFSGDGNYLPLNIQDSTTVKLNGNSVMFKGDNHSMVMNTPFDALAIGGAVMDGFRAQQYDDIVTMNGVMKVPIFFEDTIHYPVMFFSHGMPFSDTAKFALLRGSLGNEFGFVIQTIDEDLEEESFYLFSHGKFSINRDYQRIFEVNLATGIIDAPYVGSKGSTNIAQVKDIIDLTTPSIITVDTSFYNIGYETTSTAIVTLVDGSVDVFLPNVNLSVGKSIYIINDSSNGVNINALTTTDIWSNGALVGSVSIPSDSTMKLINNGSYWAIF